MQGTDMNTDGIMKYEERRPELKAAVPKTDLL